MCSCTDADNDGVCADLDCDDNNANVSNPITCDYNGSVCGDVQLCVEECPAPPTEICDSQDNDCDGEIDEDDVCPIDPECTDTVVSPA